MDFFSVTTKTVNGVLCACPDFKVKRSKDLMIRGGYFYAIWDEERQLWSRDENDVARKVDEALDEYVAEASKIGQVLRPLYMRDYKSSIWTNYKSYIRSMFDVYKPLDQRVTFLSQPITYKDYVSRRLHYDLEDGVPEAYNEIMSTLYDPFERRKLEWAIGAILNGDGAYIQKFIVLYGEAGSGKSTFLHIVEQLFEGYWTTFDAKSLGSKQNQFATHFMSINPLVAIQHDGDLSKIEDNTLLNSIISHEDIIVNEKFKAQYTDRSNAFLFLGTNTPVRISDSKSGLIRRLIDVVPSGRRLDNDVYNILMDRIPFELGRIAKKCLGVYRHFGKRYFEKYRPVSMMYETDAFYNFVSDNIFFFEENDPLELQHAYDLYTSYCNTSNASFILQRYKFRNELRNYYQMYDEKRCIFTGFLKEKFEYSVEERLDDSEPITLVLDQTTSILDDILKDCPAQYANVDEVPFEKWDKVTRTLKDIDTSKLHYVKLPENHIVIDFDLKNEKGEKDKLLNLRAAEKFPRTYAEFSKGGNGVHLHYIYDGDTSKLSRIYSEGIEVKVFNGNSSLRRKLTLCNVIPIAHISSGLPFKEEKKVIRDSQIADEKHLRVMIEKNLRKEIWPNTRPSIDFIFKLLEDAYTSGMTYDVRDMRQKILTFAMKSTNQKKACLEIVSKMHFCSDDVGSEEKKPDYADDRLVFFDVEVFPNLFLVNWCFDGEDTTCVRMINPKPKEIGELFKFKLVGFNNLRYDNIILYAAYLGYTNEQLYNLSQDIIVNKKRVGFREAKNISYTDVWDFSANKQSLKKWEIELGLHHQELGLPWDEPVPEEMWDKVAEYCDNDVLSTRAVFHHNSGDFKARQILAKLAGTSVNETTNTLTTKIIFGDNRHPKLVYTDLSETFPGYEYVAKGEDGQRHNMYRGIDVGFGGYIVGNPGVYENVAMLDVTSLHPTSAILMNYMGEYTARFKEIVDARVAIKRKDFNKARSMLDGKLAEFLDDPSVAKDLAQALKIAINSVYGLTSASFENPFKDGRNVNNIVALRGALMMKTLQDTLEDMGAEVIGIRTDSCKIANATREIVDFAIDFVKQYGYTFEFETVYDRIALVNKSAYIAKYMNPDICQKIYGEVPSENKELGGEWTATAAQFQEPYVFKTLFSKEEITFEDICQTKEVQKGALYLDMNEGLPEGEHNYQFIGRVGQFCPIKEGCGGGELVVKRTVIPKDGTEPYDKYDSASGAKGYRWLESEQVRLMSKEDDIDLTYFRSLVDEAIDAISEYDDFEHFVGEQEYVPIN